MREVVIVSAARTAVGNFGGGLANLSAVEIGVVAAKEAIVRAGISPELVNEVIVGNVLSAGLGQNVARDLNCDINKINVNGGAIALGHPIGASGARILTTLIYEMKRSNTKKGLATLCIGGGQGTALIVENI